MSGPEKVYLHIGLHKTGTTYLQTLWNLNRDGLLRQGICYPGGRDGVPQALAAADLHGKRPRGHSDKRVAGAWTAIVAEIDASPAHTALISQEGLGFSTLGQARKAVASFQGEVHVILTVRDLGRVLVSQWQEEIKNDHTWTWEQYVSAAKDPNQATQMPAVGFWLRADPVRVCDTWSAAAGKERIHIVTLPPPGAPPDTLVSRVGAVVGFDPGALTEAPVWSNEMVGAAGTEVLRRVNQELGGRLNQAQHTRAVRRTLVPMLVRETDRKRLGLPDSEFGWVAERAEQIIEALADRGYEVTGDLDELRPRRSEDASDLDEVSESAMLTSAVSALALLAEEYATAWWVRRREAIEDGDHGGDLASRVRGRLYRVKERVVSSTEHNAFVARALGWALRAEERRVAKTRAKADKGEIR